MLVARPDGRDGVVTEIRTGLTYDDVLLVPRRSRVRSRQDVSTRSSFTPGIELEVPIVSANMDTVTTAPMAVAMAQLGGIGVLHRFLPVEEEAAEVRRVKRYLTHVVGEPYVIEPGRTVAHARAEARRLQVTGLRRRRPGAAPRRAPDRARHARGRGRPARRRADDAARAARHRRPGDRARGGAAAADREPGREAAARRRGRPRHGPRDAARPLARRPLPARDARRPRPAAGGSCDRDPRRLPDPLGGADRGRGRRARARHRTRPRRRRDRGGAGAEGRLARRRGRGRQHRDR